MGRTSLAVLLLFGLLALGLAPPSSPTTTGPAADPADEAWSIHPPGGDRAHTIDEISRYDALAGGFDTFTHDQLSRYFKPERLTPSGTIEREEHPRDGVRIVRDATGVPQIYGDTDLDLAWGAGYATAQDRLEMMAFLRAVGRADVLSLVDPLHFPDGAAKAWTSDAELTRLYGYTEREYEAMLDRLPQRYGAEGEQMLRTIRSYVDGINARITAIRAGDAPMPDGFAELGRPPEPWKPTDVVAVASVVRSLFGGGGGGELHNAAFLADLLTDHPADEAWKLYEDFRNRDNRDGPVQATHGIYDYDLPDLAHWDPAANTGPFSPGEPGPQTTAEDLLLGQAPPSQRSRTEQATIETWAHDLSTLADAAGVDWDALDITTELGGIKLTPRGKSNFIILSGKKTTTGRPMLLGGPQIAYWLPSITYEVALHSPHVEARGMAVPGISFMIFLGRSRDYGWTVTSGISDMVDLRIEKLCEPDGSPPSEHSYHYVYDGRCVAMDRRTYRQTSAVPLPETLQRELPDIRAERTLHGVVMARGELDGQPVAVTRERANYAQEADWFVPVMRLNHDEATSGKRFVDIVSGVNMSFNYGYVSRDDIAYYHAGEYPRRPNSVHPDFPTWGTGQWEWQGFLSPDEHPQAINPPEGFLVSWNNRAAHGWANGDGTYDFSSLYRANMLRDPVAAAGTLDVAGLVKIMARASVTDFRGSHVLPTVLDVLAAGEAPSPREATMAQILRDWVADGAWRRDANDDGRYDHGAAVAIMDAWWPTLVHAIYDPVIGDVGRVPLELDNPPGPLGSAYQAGFYGQVYTDLSMLLGRHLASPTHRTFCGGTPTTQGSLADCAQVLWASLAQAGDSLAQQQGNDPTSWDTTASQTDRIRFLPGAAFSMHWVNRPTFQQLLSFR